MCRAFGAVVFGCSRRSPNATLYSAWKRCKAVLARLNSGGKNRVHVPQETLIELYKENMKFSAGHFTVFSATERERLHGHNYTVYASLTSRVGEDGLAVDYGIYKHQLVKMCRAYNEYFLLPSRSPYLRLEERGDQLIAHFNGDEIPFLKKDVLILPIANVTIEQLSGLLLQELCEFRDAQGHDVISAMTVKVFTGPGQSASSTWSAV